MTQLRTDFRHDQPQPTDHRTAALVYIIASDPSVRHSIEVSVASLGRDFQSVGSLEQLPAIFNGSRPHCLLVCAKGEGREETDWMSAFLEEHPTARPVLITFGCKIASAVNAMKNGFSSVLEYPCAQEHFVSAISDAITESEERISAESHRLPVTVARLLTAQEEDIVSLLLNGAATKEIAVRLNLSIRTIHYRKNAIFKKVGANSRSHLMQILTRPSGGGAPDRKSDNLPISA
jgi:FixJ family two-component response regulator